MSKRKRHRDAKIIKDLGGPAELARRLGLKGEFALQRVNNWCTRGIPAAIRLRHIAVFGMPKQADISR